MFVVEQRNGPTNIQIMKINKSEKQGIDITVDNVTYMPDAVKEGKNFLLKLLTIPFTYIYFRNNQTGAWHGRDSSKSI